MKYDFINEILIKSYNVKELLNIGYNWLLVVNRMMAEHELWSFHNALFFIILLFILIIVLIIGINTVFDIDNVSKDWANQRCNPMIMPFASIFGYNTKENFEFCMGKVFNVHSLPFIGSITMMFSKFTDLLQSIFNSLNSLRNVIASLGGGINIVFQEFTERISTFFFKLRLSAIHIKSLFMRMYAILFSVMYMGMSGITGMTSFTNTFLFSFLDTFCFPGETQIITKNKGKVPIKDVQIGDVLLPSNSTVTATFKFYSRGQPMVKLGPVTVSTNHYVMYNGYPIKAGDHPNAINIGIWDSDELLYCLNTDNHIIPVEYLSFLDYDETYDADKDTMNFINKRLNGINNEINYPFKEYGFALDENTKIKTVDGILLAKDIKINQKLSTGSYVTGIIRKQVNEICNYNGINITPSTLYWNNNKWSRFGEQFKFKNESCELLSFVVVPNSQIELDNGTIVRDYMELCSPDSEIHYSKQLEINK